MTELSLARRRASIRAAAWSLAGCLGACTAPPPPAAPAPTPGAAWGTPLAVPAVQERDAMWILLPERSEPSVVLPYDHGRTAFITDGLRVLEDPLGSLQHGIERLPGSNTNAIALSAHLGSGFLFQSD